MQEGQPADFFITSRAGADLLIKAGKVAAENNFVVARSSIALAVPAGHPRPDISTVDKLKSALLAAARITYTDPASGGPSGIHLAKVWNDLGIATQLRAKTRFPPAGGFVGDILARNEADIGIQQFPELSSFKGVDVVGALPSEVQEHIEYAVTIPVNAVHTRGGKGVGRIHSNASRCRGTEGEGARSEIGANDHGFPKVLLALAGSVARSRAKSVAAQMLTQTNARKRMMDIKRSGRSRPPKGRPNISPVGARRPAVPAAGTGAHVRRVRHLRAGRPHRLAHASARADADRHRRLRVGAARGRPDRGNTARRRRLVSARREALARRNADHRDDAYRDHGNARRARMSIGWSMSATSNTGSKAVNPIYDFKGQVPGHRRG